MLIYLYSLYLLFRLITNDFSFITFVNRLFYTYEFLSFVDNLSELHSKYVAVPADKASLCAKHTILTVL